MGVLLRLRSLLRSRFCLVFLTLLVGSRATAATGSILQRDLPRELFDGLDAATVEGWIRFDSFAAYSRFFDVGRDQNSINVTHYERSPNLLFEVWQDRTNRAGLHVIGLLRTNEWCHLAAVVGPAGQRLYFNGRLVASNTVPLSFAQLRPGGKARLGRSVWEGSGELNKPLHGALAEVRLWSRERTQAEIDRDLYRLLGSEVGHADAPAGLVKVWGEETFRRPSESEAARELPDPEELAHPGILEGFITDEKGQPVNLAQVRVRTLHQRTLAAGRTGCSGSSQHEDIAGPGRFVVAVHETRSQIEVEVFSPKGSVTIPQASLSAGERREVRLQMNQSGASAETTNHFVRRMVQDLHGSAAWLREMAAVDLAGLGDFPNAAAALASTYGLDPDESVRTQLSYSLNKLSYRSPIALAALLETPGAADWLKPEAIQATLRQRPVPAALQTVYARRTQAVALLFAGILGTFALLHLFVYLCDRRNRTDGIYTLFTGCGAVGTLLSESGRVQSGWWQGWVGPAVLALAYSLGLRLLYALFAPKIPWRFWVLNALFFVFGLKLLMLGGAPTSTRRWQMPLLEGLIVIVSLLVIAEMLRVTAAAYRAGRSGSRLVGGGLVVFALGQLLAPLSGPIFLDDVWAAWLFPLSMTVFVASASLHLAREFVRTNLALRAANQAIAAAQTRLTSEVAEAASYVRSLLPIPWTGPGIATAWAFQPSTQLGGDAFGHHHLDEHRSAFYLLDACGHGVGAALLSVSALNALRSQGLADTDFDNPADVLFELNKRFPMDAHGGQYFTAWYGVYDRRDRSLTYASAGHPPAYVLAGGTQPEPLRTRGKPIGCFPEACYENARTQLAPAASLVIISDGVYELRRPDGGPVTLADFERELATHQWTDPEAILMWARDKNGRDSLEDDFSVLRATFF